MKPFAIIIFALVSCYSAIDLFINSENLEVVFFDISTEESKYCELKDLMPKDGIVGYEACGADDRQYFVAQYALCPLVLDKSGKEYEYKIKTVGE